MTIRATRPQYYQGTEDSADLTVRDGHYVCGATVEECISKACKKFPNEPVDIQAWKDVPGKERGELIGTFTVWTDELWSSLDR